MGSRLDWSLAAGCGRRRMKRRGSPMETHRKAYTAPVSEIVPTAQDVVTASQFLGEKTPRCGRIPGAFSNGAAGCLICGRAAGSGTGGTGDARAAPAESRPAFCVPMKFCHGFCANCGACFSLLDIDSILCYLSKQEESGGWTPKNHGQTCRKAGTESPGV